MLSLNQLKNKFGNPDILIDPSSKNSKRYAIWGFKETFEIYKNGCFLNGKLLSGDPFVLFQNFINDSKKGNDNNIACIGFLSYEFKNMIYKHMQFKNKGTNNFPLLWFCKPNLIKSYSLDYQIDDSNEQLQIIKDIISLSKYSKKIDTIKSHLKSGDAYQINFTSKKKLKSNYKCSFDLYNSLRSKIKP